MDKLPDLDISVLHSYPDMSMQNLQEHLDSLAANDDHKIVVLDDDPTGVQTVHDISVYTDWSEKSIRQGFMEKSKLFYILTNSRSFSNLKTTQVHHEICKRIIKIATAMKRRFLIISRSDSTLRGHYPLETEILAEEIEKNTSINVDGEVLCPFLREGGRYTINDIHYVQYGKRLVPVGHTEFAQDKTFGYVSSNLCEYVEEKTKGKFKKSDVVTISLNELRTGKIDDIVQKLMGVHDFGKIIVNAIAQDDIKVFVIALYKALAKGKYFLFRSGAALVKEMGAIHDKPLLTSKDLLNNSASTTLGGLIIVGSHTSKTTLQIHALQNLTKIEYIEFNSDLVLDDKKFVEEIKRVLCKEEELLAKGYTVVVYTKRKVLVLNNDTKEDSLKRSVKISDAVQSFVGNLHSQPAFIIAKGGITSSDIGTKALKVKRADVLGQLCPGVPVWKTGPESKFPYIPYVIFPGNIGEENTLKNTVEILRGDKN